jgi:predicted polyphosphate/ATP-dependent NAD kinase
VATVGVIVNPLAGKDVRRLVTNASPVSDSAKIGMVRRAVVGAVEGGAERILLSDDRHQLARRAVRGLSTGETRIDVLDEPLSCDRLDTLAAASRMCKDDAAALVVFGGDGTQRDVVAAWTDAPIVPVSTGTNNAFPLMWDAAAAGTAAALVASGAVALGRVATQAKRIDVHLAGPGLDADDVALVDVALVDGAFVGARAVWDARRVRTVVAAIASPASSGLSRIAGRTRPVGRWVPGGAVVHLGPGGRRLRLPISPGTFSTVEVADTAHLAFDEPVRLEGPGVLTMDGERTHVLRAGDTATVTVRASGPHVIDVERALQAAVASRAFDVVTSPSRQEPPGAH